MRCFHAFLRSYSLFLDKYFLVFLILTPVFVVLCAVLSFAIPNVSPDLPDFSEPTKGFEPRGTFVMKRMVTYDETYQKAVGKELTCGRSSANNPSLSRKKRAPLQFCSDIVGEYLTYYVRSKLVFESGKNMMNRESILGTCSFESHFYKTAGVTSKPFDEVCERSYQSPNASQCCPSLSLGNYIAQINNRRSCYDITDNDVAAMDALLQNCSSLYFSKKLSANMPCNGAVCECVKHIDVLKNVFTYLVDKDYTRTSNILKETMVLTFMNTLADFEYFKEIYDYRLDNTFPLEDFGVKLVAFEFHDFKFDLFSNKLIEDVVFPGIGLVCIALILLIYTHSFFIMFLTVFSVLSSLIVSYFIYHFVFRLTFFPFLNVTTLIFVIGIGADDAFIFSDVWNQAKAISSRSAGRASWMEYTLKHAAVSMFVTSLTTSAAFYANVVSSITAIRLFGIYAGTTILVNYAFMMTWFPAGIIALEKFVASAKSGNPREDIVLRGIGQEPAQDQHHTVSPEQLDTAAGESNANTIAPAVTESANNDYERTTCSFCKAYGFLRSKCSQVMDRVFTKLIPKCLLLYPLWILVLVALGVGMLCAITVSPGLNRPKSSDFQVFASSHSVEQYDLKYKQKFRIESSSVENFYVYMVFGIKPEDNGNYLDPDDFGHLVYDTSFDFLPPRNQHWLVNLCAKIRMQTFFEDQLGDWSCFPETFKDSCSQSTGESFPFSEQVLQQCLAKRDGCYEDRSSPYLLDRDSGKLKVMTLAFPTNVRYPNEYKVIKRLWDDIKVFTSNALASAPPGLQGGWSISNLRFFALQDNLGTSTLSSLALSIGIAFIVILLSSLNWVISVYAIVTILFILSTTVGSLVLSGWELNILESIVISVAVGLSVDFTLHYGVAYGLSPDKGRNKQVMFSLSHIGPAVTLASITTFIAGVFMMFSTVLVYFQMGQFLTLVMALSWFYATFFFLSLCHFLGPVGHFGQLNSTKCLSCKVTPAVESQQAQDCQDIVNDQHL